MRTNEQPRRRRRGTARRITAITAVTTDHGRSRPATAGHGRSRPVTAVHGRSRPITVVTAGHGRTFRTGVTADAANAALANDTVVRPILVNERANGRIERPAPPGTRPRRRQGGLRRGRGHGGLGKHCRSRRSRPPKAERSSAGSRPQRHGDHGAQASPGSRPGDGPITERHGGHGRSRRARQEPWGLSPPGARGRADLPGDRAAAGGRCHHVTIPSKAKTPHTHALQCQPV